MEQKIITSDNGYMKLDTWIIGNSIRKLLLVCDDSIKYQKELSIHMDGLGGNIGVDVVSFSGFQPNPLYENVVEGVRLFREEDCDGIMAVGGGSAMDVAKCIKLYSGMDGDGENGSYLTQEYVANAIPFIAVPTTAGTGSEATRYAVIYYKDKKQSITSTSFIPDAVMMDPDCLLTLPDYQKKATMMDALCHAIESYWSVNSTDESKEYSRQAIHLIIENMDDYIGGMASPETRRNMLMAANVAGKAINITQTTAGHAMCYKLTSMFGVAHGHAAALCDRVLYKWMAECADMDCDDSDFDKKCSAEGDRDRLIVCGNADCIDPRGGGYLKGVLDEIGHAMGCENARDGAAKLVEIFDELELEVPTATDEQYEVLKTSVNPDRLRNHPVRLHEEIIDKLYHLILTQEHTFDKIML